MHVSDFVWWFWSVWWVVYEEAVIFPIVCKSVFGDGCTYNGFFTNFLTDISLISDIQ